MQSDDQQSNEPRKHDGADNQEDPRESIEPTIVQQENDRQGTSGSDTKKRKVPGANDTTVDHAPVDDAEASTVTELFDRNANDEQPTPSIGQTTPSIGRTTWCHFEKIRKIDCLSWRTLGAGRSLGIRMILKKRKQTCFFRTRHFVTCQISHQN